MRFCFAWQMQQPNYYEKKLGDSIIVWPPGSCNLTPSDYFLLDYFKSYEQFENDNDVF